MDAINFNLQCREDHNQWDNKLSQFGGIQHSRN